MDQPPSLDAHAHIDPCRSGGELEETGAVLAMTFSLEGAEPGIRRREARILWGAGCHPRFVKAGQDFSAVKFRALIERTALVGEVGLDTGSHVPLELQKKNFRQILEIVADHPRIVSIHSYRSTGLVLEELSRRPIATPILHWWTGSAAETSEAVRLGCYFSIHSAVARQSKFRTRVPAERILVESDHGYGDPPAAIPLRVGWAEHLVAQQYRMDVKEIRRFAWRNLGTVIQETGTMDLFPEEFTTIIASLH